MDLVAADPGLDHVAVLVDDLNRRAFQLFAGAQVDLAHIHLGLRVDHQQAAVGIQAVAVDAAVFVNGKGDVIGQDEPFRRGDFVQGIFLTVFQSLNGVDLVARDPGIHNTAFAVKHLQFRAGQHVAVRILLGRVHLGIGKGDAVLALGDLHFQAAGALLRHRHGYSDLAVVMDDFAVACVILCHGVDMGPDVVQRVTDRIEDDSAVGGIAAGGDKTAVFPHIKGVLAFGQVTAHQVLGTGQGDRTVR